MTQHIAKASEKTKTARVKLPCSGRRILIADDERSIRDIFLQVLSYGLPNCRVDVAVNGAEAIEAFRQARHSVIIMDIKMPVMDGEQAFGEIAKLCEAENWTMPSVIFCTGFDPSDRIQRIIDNKPAHCLLMKPVTNQQLLDAIRARLPPQ